MEVQSLDPMSSSWPTCYVNTLEPTLSCSLLSALGLTPKCRRPLWITSTGFETFVQGYLKSNVLVSTCMLESDNE